MNSYTRKHWKRAAVRLRHHRGSNSRLELIPRIRVQPTPLPYCTQKSHDCVTICVKERELAGLGVLESFRPRRCDDGRVVTAMVGYEVQYDRS